MLSRIYTRQYPVNDYSSNIYYNDSSKTLHYINPKKSVNIKTKIDDGLLHIINLNLINPNSIIENPTPTISECFMMGNNNPYSSLSAVVVPDLLNKKTLFNHKKYCNCEKCEYEGVLTPENKQAIEEAETAIALQEAQENPNQEEIARQEKIIQDIKDDYVSYVDGKASTKAVRIMFKIGI